MAAAYVKDRDKELASSRTVNAMEVIV